LEKRNAALIARLTESRLDFVVAGFPQANRFTIDILAVVAEYESKLVSNRIKAALAIARSLGSCRNAAHRRSGDNLSEPSEDQESCGCQGANEGTRSSA
jgi:hypothetical protein